MGHAIGHAIRRACIGRANEPKILSPDLMYFKHSKIRSLVTTTFSTGSNTYKSVWITTDLCRSTSSCIGLLSYYLFYSPHSCSRSLGAHVPLCRVLHSFPYHIVTCDAVALPIYGLVSQGRPITIPLPIPPHRPTSRAPVPKSHPSIQLNSVPLGSSTPLTRWWLSKNRVQACGLRHQDAGTRDRSTTHGPPPQRRAR